MLLAKKSSGAPPHRTLWGIPTNTQGSEQKDKMVAHVVRTSPYPQIYDGDFIAWKTHFLFALGAFSQFLATFCCLKVSCSGQRLYFTMFMINS